jgi:protein-S-isoprenylcysteine O-methyltransferase Ste14
LDQLCPSLTTSPITVLKFPSTSFLVASAIALFSAYTRYICYKTLGRLFTYEVSILPNHKLITSGPYAIVRHPSYVSAAIYTFALAAVFVSPGTYSGECLFKQVLSIFSDAIASTGNRAIVGTTIGRLMSVSIVELGAMAMLVVWLALIMIALSVAIKRLGWEERLLHEEFKDQWVAYTRAVPWRVIPGIM